MTQTVIEADRPTAPLKLVNHVIVALAVAVVAPFTGIAWPFALLTGMVIGGAAAERERGISPSIATRLARTLAVTGGVLAVLFFGAIIFGLVAFVIVALASFNDRMAAHASPTDRSLARIVVFLGAVLGFVGALALGLNVDIRIGG